MQAAAEAAQAEVARQEAAFHGAAAQLAAAGAQLTHLEARLCALLGEPQQHGAAPQQRRHQLPRLLAESAQQVRPRAQDNSTVSSLAAID